MLQTRTRIPFGEAMCSAVTEGKFSVLKKIQEIGLGNLTVPQALNSTAGAHLPLVIRVYGGPVLDHW